MKKESFYAYARRLIDECFFIMERADLEYASDDDKFANFKWQADAEGRTPEQVAITFFLKHVRALSRGVSIREPMEGRICDIINYALLIAGMRREQEESTGVAVKQEGSISVTTAKFDPFP